MMYFIACTVPNEKDSRKSDMQFFTRLDSYYNGFVYNPLVVTVFITEEAVMKAFKSIDIDTTNTKIYTFNWGFQKELLATYKRDGIVSHNIFKLFIKASRAIKVYNPSAPITKKI